MLIVFTQYMSCLISMTLTSLFALNFADTSSGNIWNHALQITLLVGMGVTLDLSKYIFWHYKKNHLGYAALSLGLVSLSCLASMAFLITHQQQAEKKAQQSSPEYISYETKMNQLKNEIALKEQSAKQRLASRYHSQWDESDRLQTEIKGLQIELNNLVRNSDAVGKQFGMENTHTSAFFSVLSNGLGLPYTTIVATTYTVLAIFLELCALGLIGIHAQHKRLGNKITPTSHLEDHNQNSTNDDENIELPSSIEQQIKHDIVCGDSEPIVRELLEKYGVRHHVIKTLLNELENEGQIRKRGNRFYRHKKDFP